jgi:pyruvate dehydrogenase E2 component (dihydrolipoamide acetyltransferase)
MPTRPIHVPHLGEGLQEARIVRFLKQHGEAVTRDEPICEVETDKAVMDLESAYEGTLVEWLQREGDIVPIGAPIATVDTPAQAPSGKNAKEHTITGMRNADCSPRVIHYLKEKGLWDRHHLIPRTDGKLTSQDIDAFLSSEAESTPTAPSQADVTPTVESSEYQNIELSPTQKTLAYHLTRNTHQGVAASITVEVNWHHLLTRLPSHDRTLTADPSPMIRIASAVVKAMEHHPRFRTMTGSGNSVREYRHVTIGIAVALRDDELGTAVVEKADQLLWTNFSRRVKAAIKKTLQGKRQPVELASVLVTDLSRFGISQAVPVLVAPAVATLFVGAPSWRVTPKPAYR